MLQIVNALKIIIFIVLTEVKSLSYGIVMKVISHMECVTDALNCQICWTLQNFFVVYLIY